MLRRCGECNWVGYYKPTWLSEAYKDPISPADTGVLQRNLTNSTNVEALLLDAKLHLASCLDMAGGYGIFVRLMRDRGFDFRWADPYASNIFAKGFEISAQPGPVEVITLFEVLEHLESPLTILSEVFTQYSARLLIASTELYTGDQPSADWWYLAPETGQHISFYNRKTLEYCARHFGVSYAFVGGLHLFGDGSTVEALGRIDRNGILTRLKRRRRRRELSGRTFTDHLAIMKTLKGCDGLLVD